MKYVILTLILFLCNCSPVTADGYYVQQQVMPAPVVVCDSFCQELMRAEQMRRYTNYVSNSYLYIPEPYPYYYDRSNVNLNLDFGFLFGGHGHHGHSGHHGSYHGHHGHSGHHGSYHGNHGSHRSRSRY